MSNIITLFAKAKMLITLSIMETLFPTVFVYLIKAERGTLPQRHLSSPSKRKANMVEWIRFTRGAKGWFDGKDMVQLGDIREITNSMLLSRGLYEPATGVFEVYVNMYEPIPYDPVRSQRSINKALKEYFGTQGMTICDVQPGKMKKGLYHTRVSFYTKLSERPDADRVEKVRDVIRAAAVEPVFEGVNKSGDTVQYAYTELPYGLQDSNRIRKSSYDKRTGKQTKKEMLKGFYWRVI